MAREFGRWFRFYDGVLDDPKVQRLSDKLFRAWVNLMCLASRRGGRIEADYADVAFSLRVTEGQARETLQALKSAGLMDIEETGIEPHNWSERQFKSDVSTERVKRFRQRSTKRDETVSETLPEADTEQKQSRADSDTEAKASALADAPASPLTASKPNFQKLSFDLADALGIARPAIGSMAKKCGQDWTAVHEVLSRCRANSPGDPTSWCMAEFQPVERSPPPGKPSLAERLTAKIGA